MVGARGQCRTRPELLSHFTMGRETRPTSHNLNHKPPMQKIGKEVKIGIAVVGVLTVAFGYVLVKKISNSGDPGPGDQTAATTPTTEVAPAAKSPAKPTVIAATDGDRLAGLPDDPKRNRWSL